MNHAALMSGYPWSAGCDESRTSGAEGGPEKRTRSNPGTALRSDPYILGSGSSAIGTLVERSTRFTMLLHLPRLKGYGQKINQKSGPAFAGHGAVAVNTAITTQIGHFPEHLRKSLAWDQGAP